MIHKYFIIVPFIQQRVLIAYSVLSLVSEALLLPGFGQVALNDIHINCQVASTQQKNANKLVCSFRCTEMLKRLYKEFQQRLCAVSPFANVLYCGAALVTAGIQLFIPQSASTLCFHWFARLSFSLCSVGHCMTQNQHFPLCFSLGFLSVSDFSRFQGLYLVSQFLVAFISYISIAFIPHPVVSDISPCIFPTQVK